MLKIEDAVRRKVQRCSVDGADGGVGGSFLRCGGGKLGPSQSARKPSFWHLSSCNRDPAWAWVWHDSPFPTPAHAVCDLGGAPDELKLAVGLQARGPSLRVLLQRDRNIRRRSRLHPCKSHQSPEGFAPDENTGEVDDRETMLRHSESNTY